MAYFFFRREVGGEFRFGQQHAPILDFFGDFQSFEQPSNDYGVALHSALSVHEGAPRRAFP